ncbi:hypothetical protein HYV74_03035 [Candidatus Uhrbacteria bacterium]|nr:hypothetical protein [Candidatus Uhrbacteria bacterium]
MPERFSLPSTEDASPRTGSTDPVHPEIPPELEEFRYFVADELEFVNRTTVEQLTPAEQLQLLVDHWRSPASFAHFQQLLERVGATPDPLPSATSLESPTTNDINNQYVFYLLHKLPPRAP